MNTDIRVNRLTSYCPICLTDPTRTAAVNTLLHCVNGHEWYYDYDICSKELWLRRQAPDPIEKELSDWCMI